MALEDRKQWLETRRSRPGVQVEGANGPARGNRFGEAVVQPIMGSKMYGLLEEGSYFIAQNATPQTAIAGHAAPVVADLYTKPYVHLRNNNTTANGTRMYLDFICLEVTAAGAGATNATWAAELDSGASRYSSGTVVTLSAIVPNLQSSDTSNAQIYIGPTVASAATASAREIGHGNLRTVVPVVGDRYLWDFGNTDKNLGSMIVGGTAVANIVVPMPPVILGPTDQFLLHLMGVSQSGAHSYEVRMGWWERP